MVIPTKDIEKIEVALRKANKAELKFQSAAIELADIIQSIIQVEGHVDHLQGDGFGFTPKIDNDIHIHISDLIKAAKDGEDINEEYILDNLSI
jgi:hypothetical protein